MSAFVFQWAMIPDSVPVAHQRCEAIADLMDHLRDLGLVLTGRGIIRAHQKVLRDGREVGEITSGGFSPTLGCSIALARVDPGLGATCAVEIRDKPVPARVVKPPFARNGCVLIEP